MAIRRILFVLTVAIATATLACTTLLGTFEVDSEELTSDSGFDAVQADTNPGTVKDGAPEAAIKDAALNVPDALVCSSDKLQCNGACVEPSGEHCSSCAACPSSTPLCIVPAGAAPSCGTSCTATEPNLCRGRCVNTATSVDFCGNCDTQCPEVANAKRTCSAGACGFECIAGHHPCGGACVSNNAIETCGSSCTACAVPANGTATCDGTSCGITCGAGTHPCNGACVDSNAVTSCGTSCTPCPAPANGTPKCDGVTCGFDCVSDFHQCQDTCSPNDSTNSCGSSCLPCVPPANATSTCDGTKCGAICSGGLTACPSGCVNVSNNASNCGVCSKQCSGGVQCSNGICPATYGYTAQFAATTSCTPGYAFAMRIYVPITMTVTRLGSIVSLGGVNPGAFTAVMALYNESGGHPYARLTMSNPSFMGGSAGNVELPVPSATIDPGYYWVAANMNTEGHWSYAGFGGTGGYDYQSWTYNGSMPATWTGTSVGSGAFNYYLVGRE